MRKIPPPPPDFYGRANMLPNAAGWTGLVVAMVALLAGLALLYGAGTAAAQTTVDYDANDNGLIDIATTTQLNAIRHDLDGNGDATHADYVAAFPNRDTSAGGRMGCPSGVCTGYELTANLTFDDDGNSNGSSAGDRYYNGGSGWLPLGNSTNKFTATFDGKNNSISYLYINRTTGAGSELTGLFGNTDGATLRNVQLLNVDINAGWRAGALVGDMNEGTITNSYSTGQVSVTGSRAGGLVGLLQALGTNSGTISGSYSTADVSAAAGEAGGLVAALWGGGNVNASVTSSYATGDVTATTYAGGLVGRTDPGNIYQSYATGAVTASGISGRAGGLVGWFRSGTSGSGGSAVQLTSNLTASYATGPVSVTNTGAGAGVGVTATGKAGGLVGEINAFLTLDAYAANRANANLTACYATGAVVGAGADNDLGGLVGLANSQRTPATGGTEGAGVHGITNVNIIASYATGQVTGASGAEIGGLVGAEIATATPNNPGESNTGSSNIGILNSYWDTGTTGIADDSDILAPEGKTTRELQRPNGYSGLYAAWNVNLDSTTGGDDPWSFGMPFQYPKLKYGTHQPVTQGSQAMGETDHKNFPVVGEPIWVCLGDTSLRGASASWQWQRSDNGYSGWTDVTSNRGANRGSGFPTYAYIPNNGDLNKYFRASIALTDGSTVYTRVFGKVRAADAATAGTALTFASGNTSPSVSAGVVTVAGDWQPTGAVMDTVRWGWQRCDNADSTYTDCQNVIRSFAIWGSGAETLSYDPVVADQGKYLRAYVYYESSSGVWTKAATPFTGAVGP